MLPSSFKSGFTLVEMMVVITIFILTTGIVLANLPAARDKNALDLLAQEIAVTIRQAQVYGAATFGVESGGAREFPSYGVYLPKNGTGPLYEFYIFSDVDNDQILKNGNCQDKDICLEQFVLRGGVGISEIYYCPDQGCQGGGDIVNPFNILFERPGTDAVFTVAVPNPPDISHVRLRLANLKNETRDIVIWNTGHIYVDLP